MSDAGMRPQVFVSYAWEDEKHKSAVLLLARLLLNAGADVWLDAMAVERGPEWAAETAREIADADFVLVIASPAYKRRMEGAEEPGQGRGVKWEARHIVEFAFTHEQDWTDRVLNVVLPGGSVEDIPTILLPNSRHRYEIPALTPQGVSELTRRLRTGLHPTEAGVALRETGRPRLRIGELPPTAAWFQEREVMAALRETVQENGTTVVCQILDGMGGVGKSQLAARYAQQRFEAGSLDLLVWVGATSRDAVISGYARAARAVLPESALTEGPEAAARAFLEWLAAAPAPPCRWLVVLDDVPDPATLDGLWPPVTALGRTLLTTRRPDAALFTEDRHRVTVGLFTEPEALAYLRRSLVGRRRAESDEELAGLAADLGHLPVALAQAGAYVADASIPVAEYRRLLADQTVPLAELAPEDDALPDAYHLPMAKVWALSVERADRLRPPGLARPMLQLVSLLSPDGIPEAVLTSASALAYLTAARVAATPGTVPPPQEVTEHEARQTLRALRRLSLITHEPDESHLGVRAHQLVQRATRDDLPVGRRDGLVRCLAGALAEVWPDMDADPVLAQVLRANATVLTGLSGDLLHRERVHPVLDLFGHSLGHAGQAVAARQYFHDLLEAVTRSLGPEHPDLWNLRNGLAHWTGQAGDNAGALAAYDALIADTRRLAVDEAFLLELRSHRAWWLGRTGAYQAAVAECLELLPEMRRVLGEDHQATLSLEQAAAHWQWHSPHPTGQDLTGYQQRVDRARQKHGPDHPRTFTAREGLALAYERADDPDEALTLYRALLADMERVLGAKHPQTLAARRGAAGTRDATGDTAGAITELRHLLPVMTEVLGEDDLECLTVRLELAGMRGRHESADVAVTMLTELLEDTRRIVGPEGQGVSSVVSHLARWRGEAGDLIGAVEAARENLRLLQGAGHVEEYIVDRARKGLRHWLLRTIDEAQDLDLAGRRAAARELRDALAVYPEADGAYREYIAFLTSHLGPGAPPTLAVRRDLARWRSRTGDAAGAERDLVALLADQTRALGPHAYDTLLTRHALHRLRTAPLP
ncbi:tetratricopeptide repeat protein [Streptomyces sp. NPDC007110]|uniref:tetratricopeptide repeat protein n=1 Tax=Streptomyces sp. NPDC007110 TaxID=3156916 RepID=UPI0033EE9262